MGLNPKYTFDESLLSAPDSSILNDIKEIFISIKDYSILSYYIYNQPFPYQKISPKAVDQFVL